MCSAEGFVRMSGLRTFALIVLGAVSTCSAALACGPDFPQNLLDDRKASLLELPEGTFDFEAAHLLPKPDDHLRAVEGSPWGDAAGDRAKAEAPGLGAGELAKVQAMRAAPDANAAAAAGAGLAPELLEYTLGAIAFKHGDMASASAHFEHVLALPTMQRTRRGLWAQYMLGRAQAASGDTDGAIAAFESVREHALAGADDPLGIAVASFGEQARIQWHHGNIAGAVKSYATQAAHGSRSGRASLLFVARSILGHPELLDRALDDPLTQRLLAAYFYTRSDEFAQDWPVAGTQVDAGAGDADDATSQRKSAASVDIEGFLAAVRRHGLDHFDGAGRLAAGAYRAGRYSFAAQLAAKSATPLSAWVRAKLALRAGDQATALREYADAARGFPVDESWGNDDAYSDAVDSPRCRVESERGVLALSRGEYLDAMARLFAGAREYWPDAAYVAERVLTVDELKDFVQKNVPAVPGTEPAVQGDSLSLPSSPSEQLRGLLARRLLRAGRDDEALAYFDDPALRKQAMALIAARRDAGAWTRIGRTEAIYRQAQLTRGDGMQLLGTELAPDYAMWDGDYAYDGVKLQPAGLVGKDEPARVLASAAIPDRRYHYRYVAAALAEQAASLVPSRSQAYAALMCKATAWVIDIDPKRAAASYGRYLRMGAHVAWGRAFGRACPQPDFHGARWLPWKQRYRAVRHWGKRAWPLGLVALCVLLALQVLRKRRRAVA
jgi:hypothetical protein